MKNYINKKYILILFLSFLSTFSYGKGELKAMSDFLDHIINNKEEFTRQKEQVIGSLHKLLKTKNTSKEYEYEINLELYKEYKKFKLDSAIHYAKRNVEIANNLNDPELIYDSEINLANVYSYSGKPLESERLLKEIPRNALPRRLLESYYETYQRFYEHYRTISNQSSYGRLVETYRDSLLSVLDPGSFKYKVNMVHRCLSRNQVAEAKELLFELLETESIDTPEYAMITHYLGSVAGREGERELEKKYYTLSAIADIKNSIKENASFQRLARIYYDNGDIARAFKYAQTAIEDAVFSGVQFRTAELSQFYSIINASYQAKEAKTNNKLKSYLFMISILSLFLILLVIYVYKQMKKISGIKEVLSETNNRLTELNNELNHANDLLHDKNAQLSESNQIKEQYIAQFFHLCSAYIDKMEENRKTLYKLTINRHYEELVRKLRSTTVVENELEELYAHFDTIFIGLYPTFVPEFNALLAKDEQISLKANDLLTRELRIYALLRLGITDGAKIASFLRCSVSTIYNYRTKMRNKAACGRDEFEEMVMKIGVLQRNTENQ